MIILIIYQKGTTHHVHPKDDSLLLAWKKSQTKECMKEIRKLEKFCPDYEIIEWNEDNLDISSNLYSKQAYGAKAWAFVTERKVKSIN